MQKRQREERYNTIKSRSLYRQSFSTTYPSTHTIYLKATLMQQPMWSNI